MPGALGTSSRCRHLDTRDDLIADVLGMRPRRTHALFLALIAAAVIGSYQAVGTLLVFGLLVGPPATAALLARTVPAMMAMATGIALFSAWVGLIISDHLGTAGSATIGAVPIVLFFIPLGVVGARRGRQRCRPLTGARCPAGRPRRSPLVTLVCEAAGVTLGYGNWTAPSSVRTARASPPSCTHWPGFARCGRAASACWVSRQGMRNGASTTCCRT